MVKKMKKMMKGLVISAVATLIAGTVYALPQEQVQADVATPKTGVTVGVAPNNVLLVDHAIGGGQGVAVSIETDVTFKQNAEKMIIGLSPTKEKADIASTSFSGNGFAGSDYLIYWNNGTEFRWTAFKNNTYTQEDVVSTVQDYIVGNVQLKLEIDAYGIYDLYMKVPSSNTEMQTSVQRDEWIALMSLTELPRDQRVGIFQEYDVTEREGVNAFGYLYFSMENVVYNSISITPNTAYSTVESFTDNLTDAEVFVTNYVTNDVFDAGIVAGTISVPQSNSIGTKSLQRYFYSYDEITFAPVVNSPEYTLADVTMTVSKGGTAVDGVNGLSFTPTEDGTYDITFSALEGAVTATHQIVVVNMPQQSSVNTKFDGSISDFAQAGVEVADNKATMSANAFFGTKGRAKNFVQMVRITAMDSSATDFSVYFGKQTEDAMYKVTFTKGSTNVTIMDDTGTTTKDIGVDVFTKVDGAGLVVQIKKVASEMEIALTYGDLPIETLNEPVATFPVNAALVGQIGIATVSGGLQLDRYVFVNYTGAVDIPDADITEDEDPDSSTNSTIDSTTDSTTNSGNGGDAGKQGCGCGSTIGVAGLTALLPLALLVLRKREE